MLNGEADRRESSSLLELRQFSLFLRFNGHSPGEPGLVGVSWSKGWWKWWWQLQL